MPRYTLRLYPGKNSPRESMAWIGVTAEPVQHDKQRLRPYQLRSVWMRLWQATETGWQVVPWPVQEPVRYRNAAEYSFDFLGQQTLYLLQMGGPKMPWRLISLPADNLLVFIQPVDLARQDEDPVTVTVASRTQQAEALLGYMVRGEFGAAHSVDQAIIAENLLFAKRENPAGAAIGGYYLLRIGDLERLHTWTQNLASWMDRMPDGAVILAWHLLRQTNPGIADARRWLLEATKRGLPLYTEGVRLLVDGLVMFDDDAESQDIEIRDALAQVRSFAATVDWTRPTTTFRGKSPLAPSAARVTGYPETSDDVVFST